MRHSMLFAGDLNLMAVNDPTVPFRRVTAELNEADVLFGNLECCLYQPSVQRSLTDEGFYAPPAAGRALSMAGFDVVGNANNATFGTEALRATLRELDSLGIAHTGAGENEMEARAPVIIEKKGLRFGFLQRTSAFFQANHEAGEHSPGVATVRGHTAYRLPLYRTRPGVPIVDRPGAPPEILTWTDPQYLAKYRDDVAALRKRADVVVASHHWGLFDEVLAYMSEIAHAAIDEGADIVVGHGPHQVLPVEVYKGKPIFYGLGSLSFHTGHRGRIHGNWVGMMARVALEDARPQRVSLRFVRHNSQNETTLHAANEETEVLAKLSQRSAQYGARLDIDGLEVLVTAQPASAPAVAQH